MAEEKVSNMTMLFTRCSPLFAGHHLETPAQTQIEFPPSLRLIGIWVAYDEEKYGMRTAFQAMGRQRARGKEIRRREIEPREREDVPVGSSNFEPRLANPSFYACLTSGVLASEGLEGRGVAGVVVRAKIWNVT
jgi:hypothetical protein